MKSSKNKHWTDSQDTVELYLLNKLDEQEYIEFTEHLNNCAKCKNVVEKEKKLIDGIKLFGRIQKKRQLKDKIKKHQPKEMEWIQVASIAATLILVLSIAFVVPWIFDYTKSKNIDISLTQNQNENKSIWIMGEIITSDRKFNGKVYQNKPAFQIQLNSSKTNVYVKCHSISDLPIHIENMNTNQVPTYLERNNNQINLNIYMDLDSKNILCGIETISNNTLIVFINGKQVLYKIS